MAYLISSQKDVAGPAQGKPDDRENIRLANESVQRCSRGDRLQPMAHNSDDGVVTRRNNFSPCRSERSTAEGRIGLRCTVPAQNQ
jgi:hypothetical protein